jgi:D-amino-acid oxidase
MDTQPRVLVIGAGVIGLTTALCLRRQGARVTIIADRFAPNLTSVVAGALWEWPPAVCGYHQNQLSLDRSKGWCMESYKVLSELAADPTAGSKAGIYFRPVIFYFFHPVNSNNRDRKKMEELKSKVLGFRHDASLIQEQGINPDYGLRDAYEHLAPMVDTDAYMQWLRSKVEEEGCVLVQQKVTSELRQCASALKDHFSCDFIVNSSGLGAKELGDKSVYPLRGALVRVISNTVPGPRLQVAHCVSHDETQDTQDIVFIVPRGENLIVLGGLAEAEEWNLNVNLDNYLPISEMHERCCKFLPRLRSAKLDASEPVRVGLRPFRRENVRLEADADDFSIIHSYGHGGAGVTLSWGCAKEVVKMIFRAHDTRI